MNTMTNTFLASVVLLYSGCATVRPHARVIDATNQSPVFSFTSEKEQGKAKDYHKDKWDEDTGKLEKHKESNRSKSKTTTYDFTF